MLLLTLACSVLHLTSSLTDSEIAKFTNKGCATPAGNVTITKSTDGTSLTIYSNGVPDHVWGSVSTIVLIVLIFYGQLNMHCLR